MRKITQLAMMAAMTLALPLSAQDFGYPKEKAFYKAHWDEVVNDLYADKFYSAQYILFDFDKDGSAELYLWFDKNDEYLYSIKDVHVVRVSETARPVEDQFWLGSFYPHFMAPYEMLIDAPIDKNYPTEQHLYAPEDIPSLWFKLDPVVTGTFNIKSVVSALYMFDCVKLSEALYALETGTYSKDEVQEFVVDTANGYAKLKYRGTAENMVELCYWNMANGEKLVAMHYHMTDEQETESGLNYMEQTLFMKYNPKTKHLVPIVAPIEGFDFQLECNIRLPRKGKNIELISTDIYTLTWTGSGFKACTD